MTHFARVTLQDRGLAYGDGLFETLRLSRGRLSWWSEHFARMCYTCCALGLPPPEEVWLRAAVDSAIEKSGKSEAVVKLIYTAGSGQRGYLRAEPVEPTLTVLVGDTPATAATWSSRGLALGLVEQSGGAPIPVLRGLKHLNRLPQVLARAAWPEGVDECLIHDEHGLVMGGTQSNFYWLEDGRWFTPPIRGSAIAGIVRALMCHHLGVSIAPLSVGRLALVQAAALSNAVRGVLPIAMLTGRRLPIAAAVDLATRWRDLSDRLAYQKRALSDSVWVGVQRQASAEIDQAGGENGLKISNPLLG